MNNILKASPIFLAGVLSSSIAGLIYGWIGYHFDLFLIFPFAVMLFVVGISSYTAKILLYNERKSLFALSLLMIFPRLLLKHHHLYIIGLTGNIACGKSTVLGLLRECGAQVLDADRVTHELQAPGQPVYHAIVAEFGAGILSAPAGPIDRRALGAIVFADPAALRRLEQIVHPAVRERIMSWLASVGDEGWGLGIGSSSQPPTPNPQPQVAVIDAIKLLEGGWKQICDAIWVVTCPPEQQLARLVSTRGMSEDEARARIAAQPPQADKVAQADVVIDNGGSLDDTRRQVEAAWQALLDRR